MRNQKVWEPLSPSLSSSPPGWGQWSNRLVEEWVWILLQDVELYFMYHCLTNFQEITFLVVFSSKFTVITEKKPKHHHPMLRHQLVSHTLDKRADKAVMVSKGLQCPLFCFLQITSHFGVILHHELYYWIASSHQDFMPYQKYNIFKITMQFSGNE